MPKESEQCCEHGQVIVNKIDLAKESTIVYGLM